MNSQRSGRILPNKKDTVSGVSFYSAIQLPAAISIWESSGFLVLRSENVQLPEGRNLGKLYPPGFLSKYFRPHLVNRVDFAPSMTSARITPAPAVACLQADTAVIRLQPYLRQTSLNFPKWECLILKSWLPLLWKFR